MNYYKKQTDSLLFFLNFT